MKKITIEMLKQTAEETQRTIDKVESTKQLAMVLEDAISKLDYDKVTEIFHKVDEMFKGTDVLTVMTVLIHLMAYGLERAGPIFLEWFHEEHKVEPDFGQVLGLLINAAHRQLVQERLDTSARGKRK